MKKITIVVALIALVLTANCQKRDQTFDVRVLFRQGIEFGDGTIMTTAATGVGTITWDGLLGKPTTFTPSNHSQDWLTITGRPTTLSGYGITDAASILHTHSLLYKPLEYVPTWGEVTGKPVFSAVATTGSFNDLADVPEFIQIEEALPLLNGIKLPVLTQTEIEALTPVKGLLLFNDTEGVLQIYNGVEWKTVIANL